MYSKYLSNSKVLSLSTWARETDSALSVAAAAWNTGHFQNNGWPHVWGERGGSLLFFLLQILQQEYELYVVLRFQLDTSPPTLHFEEIGDFSVLVKWFIRPWLKFQNVYISSTKCFHPKVSNMYKSVQRARTVQKCPNLCNMSKIVRRCPEYQKGSKVEKIYFWDNL